MLSTIAWRSVRANPARFLGTLLAVVVATTFLSGALVLRDSLSDALTANAVSALGDVDLAVEPVVDVDDPMASFGLAGVGLPIDTVGAVSDVDGVTSAIGQAQGATEVLSGDTSIGAAAWVVVDDPLTPWEVVDGRLPTEVGEVVVDVDLAESAEVGPGDVVRVASREGAIDRTVVGTSRFGEQAARAEADVLVPLEDAAAFTTVQDSGWDTVLAAIDDDADVERVLGAAEEAAAEVAAGADGGVEVLRGDELREREAGAAAAFAEALGVGLQAFAYLALVVGALIIFNTFTTIVAQRTREFALLRALGTSARQVRRAVRIEALVVSFVASALGALLGVGIVAIAIAAVASLRNVATLAVSPWSMLQVIASGVVVTLVSALVPAFRASRTRPVEAMRDADPTTKPVSLARSIIGLALLALGVVGVAGGSIGSIAWLLGGGAVLLLVGVIVGGPSVVAWVARRLRPLLASRSAADELAVAEVERNSRRTAATANALVIGVFLVVFVTSVGGAIRDFAVDQLEQLAGADLSLASTGEDPIPAELAPAIADVDGVDRVTEINTVVGELSLGTGGPQFGGGGLPVAATDLADLTDVLGIDVTSGSVDDGGLALAGQIAGPAGVGLGDTVDITLVGNEPVTVEVTALTGFSLDIPPAVLATSVVEDAIGPQPVYSLGVRYDDGVDLDATRGSIEELSSQYAGVDVIDANQVVSLVRSFFTFLLSAVGGLLGVAVVIALFGILNTLVLAIAERTRELGLLRSVGMTRSQLRRMIRTEALVTSLVGTVVGAVLGVGVAYAVSRVILDGAFTWPWLELAITLVLGVVVGVLASLYPARRATRLDPLDAIRT